MNPEISATSTLSHYRIVSKIGAGGMGEVYRARDERLRRDVAIKVLPADFARDEDRLRRFEQEARATSALNHPNILTVHDIGTHENAPYIVTELLDGEELRAALSEGPFSPRKAIDYGRQIVAGLSAAHERGVVHRDLKPENVFITRDGRVKILDFGLAKLKPTAIGGADSEAPTQKPLTNPGAVMGTVGYMSPEQVRGQEAGHRSDIFSFGVILYEMLSGQKPFAGDSAVELMNAILKEDVPELDSERSNASPGLERIMRRCLEKKPEHRFYSAHDLGFALEALSAPSDSSGNNLTRTASTPLEGKADSRAWRGPLPWIVAGAFALVSLVLGLMYFNRPSADGGRALRLSFTVPPDLAFNDTMPDAAVISPDGQKIAFTATAADGKMMLYVRALDSNEARLLPGSENALEPFWSPDSRSIAFGSNGKLKRSDLSGGNAQVLCDAARLVGGTWSKEGIIVFGPDYRTTLLQISAHGGEPKPAMVTSEDQGDGQRHPYFLPDNRHFLFRRQMGAEARGIWVGSLDSREIKQLVPDTAVSVYAPPGWLIFVRNDTLVAQAFDAGKLALAGEPIPIIDGEKNELGVRRFSVSDNGVLLWQGAWQRDYQLVWFDRAGKQIGTLESPVKVSIGHEPHISPDGKRVALKKDSNLWVVDLEKGTGLRITSTFSQAPVWSPDGKRILYSGPRGLSLRDANGLGEIENVLPGANFPSAWSPDGRLITYIRMGVKTRADLWALSMFGDRKEYPLTNSPFDEQKPQFSPNGRWLAYSTDETGDHEIYVQSFLAEGKLGGERKRISTTGGQSPVWRRDGNELFFVALDGNMMSAAVRTDAAEFEFNSPKMLFKTRILSPIANFREFDVSPDGQRFLIGTRIGESKAQPPTVIVNWAADLKE